jgi:hypothetical protein
MRSTMQPKCHHHASSNAGNKIGAHSIRAFATKFLHLIGGCLQQKTETKASAPLLVLHLASEPASPQIDTHHIEMHIVPCLTV